MSQMCRICLSPYREELMRAWKAGFPRKMLFEKYKPLIWEKKKLNLNSFLTACYKHVNHKSPEIVVVRQEGGKSTGSIAKMITELYARKVEGMGPKDITTRDYVSANKLVLDEQKLSLDKNAQMLEFAKIFGIPEREPVKILDGEEINAELGPDKDTGDKSQGT